MPRSRSSRRPVLIFDFGNVVAHFDYARACARVSGPLGLSGDELLARARSAGLGPLVRQYECGRISDRAFAERFCVLVGVDLAFDEFAAAWADIFWLNEPVAEIVARLRGRGYPLILGSNTNAIHARRYCRQFADTLTHFDRRIFSFEVGHTKPAPEFFDACAQAAGAKPEECVFIDDLSENLAGAREIGMVGVLYVDGPALVADLRRLGIEIS